VGRILFLGAGASIAASYPPTAKLLSSLAADAASSSLVQYRDAWTAWRTYLDNAPAWLRLVLENPNPEVALSLPDLFDLAVAEQDEHRFTTPLRQLDEKGVDLHAELEDYYDSEEREALVLARRARLRLVDALHWYFLFQHSRDSEAGRTSRDYLRRQLAAMAPGDIVITTNWDPLTERTLAEDGRWGPADGYGYAREIVQEVAGSRRPLPPACSKPSEVPVLKLHGCFGWRDIGGRFFLEGVDFLDVFGFYCTGRPIQVRDREEPELYHPSDPVVAFPSYLKPLSHSVLLEVWKMASRAATRCTEFVAGGYSLPASDAAVRALLLPIANEVREGRVKATIVDQSKLALDRWRDFLGPNVRLVQQTFESAPVLFEA